MFTGTHTLTHTHTRTSIRKIWMPFYKYASRHTLADTHTRSRTHTQKYDRLQYHTQICIISHLQAPSLWHQRKYETRLPLHTSTNTQTHEHTHKHTHTQRYDGLDYHNCKYLSPGYCMIFSSAPPRPVTGFFCPALRRIAPSCAIFANNRLRIFAVYVSTWCVFVGAWQRCSV